MSKNEYRIIVHCSPLINVIFTLLKWLEFENEKKKQQTIRVDPMMSNVGKKKESKKNLPEWQFHQINLWSRFVCCMLLLIFELIFAISIPFRVFLLSMYLFSYFRLDAFIFDMVDGIKIKREEKNETNRMFLFVIEACKTHKLMEIHRKKGRNLFRTEKRDRNRKRKKLKTKTQTNCDWWMEGKNVRHQKLP